MSWLDIDLGESIIKSLNDLSPDMIITSQETAVEGDDSTLPTTGRMIASINEAIAWWTDLDHKSD